MNQNGSAIFGGDWFAVIVILLVLFGGGLGFGGGHGPMPDVATKEFVQDAVNNSAIQNQLNQIALSSANNNYEVAQRINDQTTALMQQGYAYQLSAENRYGQIQQQIAQLGFQMENCCCSIKTQMLQDKYEAVVNQLRQYQADASNNAQTQYILNALGRFVAYPPAAATIATAGAATAGT